ncbi:hypothetical protein K490DRAFT_61705 [Saccharata proteae CBS 121410]|uniref:Uncharacterized protein n=1 Tax=Saccharata proteae CBS 121410 TaxID=1314787 RepID=A0A9P4I3W8_9PEZI|nr:hypothetical protein K490DRAFT_61705 [Saccharata proteae CBS 121410]
MNSFEYTLCSGMNDSLSGDMLVVSRTDAQLDTIRADHGLSSPDVSSVDDIHNQAYVKEDLANHYRQVDAVKMPEGKGANAGHASPAARMAPVKGAGHPPDAWAAFLKRWAGPPKGSKDALAMEAARKQKQTARKVDESAEMPIITTEATHKGQKQPSTLVAFNPNKYGVKEYMSGKKSIPARQNRNAPTQKPGRRPPPPKPTTKPRKLAPPLKLFSGPITKPTFQSDTDVKKYVMEGAMEGVNGVPKPIGKDKSVGLRLSKYASKNLAIEVTSK